jgi:hypothetical protein
MAPTIKRKLNFLIQTLQNLYFPLAEYASLIRPYHTFFNISKVEIKFSNKSGEERTIIFEESELATIQMRGVAKSKMVEFEEKMQRVAVDLKNAEGVMEKEIVGGVNFDGV